MSRLFVILDEGGERRVDESALPLRVGGSGADVVVPGWPAGGVAAYVALSDGHAYVQPVAAGAADLFLNHERLTSSTWLKSGDSLEVGGGVIGWEVRGDQVFVRVSARSDALVPPATPPPTISAEHDAAREGLHRGGDAAGTDAGGNARDDAGAPSTLPNLAAPARVRSAASSRLRRATTVGLVALAAVALYFAVSSPIVVEVRPEPEEYELGGFPPPLRLFGRYLALPGTYTLTATREGYHPLEQRIEVGFGERAEAEAEMVELPGRVTLVLEPDAQHRGLRVLVDGDAAVRGADGAWQIARGSRTVRVETQRFLPAEARLEVAGFGREQELSLVLAPGWADVRLESAPPGADVTVDDVAIGRTPLDADLMRGERTVVVSLEGHKPVTLLPTLEAGAQLSFTDIVLDPLDGRLLITSEPASATLTVDGAFVGVTPATVEVAADVEHEIRVTEPGYLADERTVSVASDADREVVVELKPEYGTVFVASRPADAELLVDGSPSGSATRRLRLTTRPHRLEIRKKGYEAKQVNVTPRAGVSQTVEVELVTVEAAAIAREKPTITTGAGQVLLRIRPAGEFMMGASRREPGRRANESRRRVELTRDFYLATTEVTNAQFRQFRAAHDSGSADDAALDGDRLPVVRVTWEDAARYCNWLSKKDGLPPYYVDDGTRVTAPQAATTGYRLPTEAEWAYAARVWKRESPARYVWDGGYPPTSTVGNFADASIDDTLAVVVPGYSDGYRGTAPVGSFPAGPGGLYDLGGNVAEWTHDHYAIYPGEDQKLVRDPTGPASGEHHVVRGASWRHGAVTELRASYRDYSKVARSDVGFRLARDAR